MKKTFKEIKYCKKCLYSTEHPLGLVIDETGLCSGCLIHDEKYTLNWDERYNKLKELVKPHKSKSRKNYDCIVPVSGDLESYFILDIVKNKLGLNPLLVTYNKYWNTEIGIINLANLRIKFDCDIIFQNINVNSIKNIVRTSIKEFGSIYWHCIAGQTVFPVQIAVKYDIPLIIWGAHQGVEQVGMYSHLSEVEMTRRYRKDHDLMGYEADDLLSNFNILSEKDIWQFRYPSDTEIKKVGVRGIYLSNYIPWDSRVQNEKVATKFSCFTASHNRTFNNFDHIDCYNFMNLHDQLKLYKCGFSKVTDHACSEIRHKRMTRNEGLALVREYEQKKPDNISLFCNWLNVREHSLNWSLSLHRNPLYWQEKKYRDWEFFGHSTRQVLTEDDPKHIFREFKNFNNPDLVKTDKYITFGKGVY